MLDMWTANYQLLCAKSRYFCWGICLVNFCFNVGLFGAEKMVPLTKMCLRNIHYWEEMFCMVNIFITLTQPRLGCTHVTGTTLLNNILYSYTIKSHLGPLWNYFKNFWANVHTPEILFLVVYLAKYLFLPKMHP